MGHPILVSSIKLKLLIIIIIINYITLFQLYAPVNAEGGIAISGSFNKYHYKTVAGETISTPDIDIIVHNNYNTPLKMTFAVEAPKDVSVDLEGKKVTIPSKSSRSFPVAVSVGKSVVPGIYEIGVSAEPIPDKKSGIAVLGGAQLRTKLSVFGEAGKVLINVIDPEGEPFVESEIKLFKKDGNSLTSVAYGRGSKLEERIAVGEYITKVYYKGDEVGQSSFSVKKDEIKEITIQAKTIFVQGFSVTPQYTDKNMKEISSVRVSYTLKNLYKPVDEAKVLLGVYYSPSNESKSLLSKLDFLTKKVYASSPDDSLLEEVEMATYPTLELGSQSGRYVYVPIDKWENGIYKFSITVLGKNSSANKNIIYGKTEEIELIIDNKNNTIFIPITVLLITLVLIALFILRKKKLLKIPKNNSFQS